jgi:hypothetical protein
MSIRTIKERPIYLTQSELNQLRDEYKQAYLCYSGTPPTFEEWVRSKQKESGNA